MPSDVAIPAPSRVAVPDHASPAMKAWADKCNAYLATPAGAAVPLSELIPRLIKKAMEVRDGQP